MVVRDASLFEIYKNIVFDRQAFKGTFEAETGNLTPKYLSGFEQAIFDTVIALQYGAFKRGIFNKEIPSLYTIENQEYKNKIEKVKDDLYAILGMMKKRRNQLPIVEIDSARDKIIDTLNGIWKELNIKPLKLPTEYGYTTEVKSKKVSLG